MPILTFQIQTPKNTSALLSPQDLRERYLFGLPTEKNGQSIPESTYEFYLDAAQQLIESMLGLRLNREVITETRDFINDDWVKWGYIRVSYPVAKAYSLEGYLGTTKQVTYPKAWLSVRKTSDGRTYDRNMYLVPAQSTVSDASAVYSGLLPNLGWFRTFGTIPNYWTLKYITGFPGNKIPNDILQAMGMLAAMPMLGVMSDLVLGTSTFGFGMGSKSISMDGLSQSVSTFANGQAGIFGARIKQYNDQLFGVNGKPGLIEILKNAYSAILMSVA